MDPFSVLGVDPRVSEAELTAAYRREARRWHPDRRRVDKTGRRVSFGDLRPDAAEAIASGLARGAAA